MEVVPVKLIPIQLRNNAQESGPDDTPVCCMYLLLSSTNRNRQSRSSIQRRIELQETDGHIQHVTNI